MEFNKGKVLEPAKRQGASLRAHTVPGQKVKFMNTEAGRLVDLVMRVRSFSSDEP